MKTELNFGDRYSTQDEKDPFPPCEKEHNIATVKEVKNGWVLYKQGARDNARLSIELFLSVYKKKLS